MNLKEKKHIIYYSLAIFVVISVFFTFCPYKTTVNTFNSDSSIPILMAQNPIPSIYSFFFYGQTRFAAYPFLFVFFISKIFNFTATANTIYFFAFAYLIGAIFYFASTVKAKQYLLIPTFATMCVIFSQFSFVFFSIEILYIWQIGSLILYATFLLRSIQNANEVNFYYFFLAAFFAFLASSSNPVSAPYLLAISPFIYIFKNFIEKAISIKKFTLLYFISFLPSFLLEEIIKIIYSHYNEVNFNKTFSYPIEALDFSKVFSHLLEQTSRIFTTMWFFVVIIIISCNLILFKLTKKMNLISTVFLALAIINFLICIFSKYVSSDNYPIRFYTPTYCFLLLAFSFVVTDVFSYLNKNNILSKILIILCMCIICVFCLSQTKNNLKSERNKWLSDTLAQLYPKTILWGQYWDVYLIRGLQSNLSTAAYPIPMDGDYNRTRWDLCRLKVGKYIIVAAESNFNIIGSNHRANALKV